MSDTATIEPGDLFEGRYRIERQIGEGGFAKVYLATQQRLERPVAIKLLHHAATSHERLDLVRQRFEQEAQLLSRLSSPHTLVIHDFGITEDDRLYMISEYLDGVSLVDLVRAEGRQPEDLTRTVLEHVLQSLREAHEQGIVHRDIKPSNIMIVEERPGQLRAKLLDFGIAKVVTDLSAESLTGDHIIGTPRYMAPEQLDPQTKARCGPSSDLYSLGLVLYEMLTGAPAHDQDSFIKVIAAQLSPEKVHLDARPGLSEPLRQIINRMLCKDPAQRWQSADALLEALSHDAPTPPTPLLPLDDPTIGEEAEMPILEPSSRAAPVIGALVAASLLITAIAIALWPTQPPPPPANPSHSAALEPPPADESIDEEAAQASPRAPAIDAPDPLDDPPSPAPKAAHKPVDRPVRRPAQRTRRPPPPTPEPPVAAPKKRDDALVVPSVLDL